MTRFILICLLVAGCGGPSFTNYTFEPLEFPYANPSDVVSISAYGIPWGSSGDTHNGIDLATETDGAEIISPTKGTIKSVYSTSTFTGSTQYASHVEIHINSEWLAKIVFEPSTTIASTGNRQLGAITVKPGDVVGVGTKIGKLIAGEGTYTHIHHMLMQNNVKVCPYNYSSPTAKNIYDIIASNGAPDNNVPDGNICHNSPT